MSLTLVPLLSIGSIQEDPSQHVDLDVNNEIKQAKNSISNMGRFPLLYKFDG